MESISINTKGHCFFCLDEDNGFETQPLQSLCRYSKIDVGNILTSLTFGVASSSNVKVSLCIKCNKLVSQISSKYQLLESLQMELDNLVRTVHKSIEGADAQEKSIRKEKFLANMNEDLGCRLQLKLVEELRMTLFNKCNKMGSTLQPRVDDVEFKPIIKAEQVTVLIDEDQGHVDTMLPTGIDGNDDSARSQSQNEEETIQLEGETTLKKKRGRPPTHKNVQSGKTLFKKKRGRPPGQLSGLMNKLRENSHLNPASGKIKCAKCPKEFKDIWNGFRWHFESKHLGIRHNCSICEKSFSLRAGLYQHKKVCHQNAKRRGQPKLTESKMSTSLQLDGQEMNNLFNENISEKADENENSENVDLFKSIKFSKCKDCNQIFYNLDTLKEHRRAVHFQ